MNQEIALPKNIRQIGEIQQDRKVYLEDYVMTYIRKKEKEGKEGCAGILMGKKETDEQGNYLFLTGALLLDQELEAQERWKKLEEEKNNFFPELEMWGYFLIGTLEEERLEEITERLTDTPMIIFHLQEGEDNVYWVADKQYYRLKGYFIFYERNPQMQKYIAETGAVQRVEEEGGNDQAILSFREKVKAKTRLKKGGGVRYLASSFLVLTILMLGVTIVNGYDKMKSMETMIEQISQEQKQQELEAAQTMSMETEAGGEKPAALMGSTMAEMQAGEADAEGGTKEVQTREAEAVGTVQETMTASDDTAEIEKGENSTVTAMAETGSEQTEAAEDSNGLQEVMAGLGNQDAAEVSGDSAVSIAEQSLAERNYSAENVSTAKQENTGKADEVLAAAERQSQSVYTIKYGDTLADISEKYYGSLEMVEKICEQNQIDDANMIVPGQKIVLP